MPAERSNRRQPLTLVASAPSSRADPSRAPKPKNDWSALMTQAQDGDRHAYRVLLEDVSPYLRALASRCFGDPSDVEDAVQDVLLAIHMMRKTYDPARPFGPWLVAIAKRRIIDRLRRKTRTIRASWRSPQSEKPLRLAWRTSPMRSRRQQSMLRCERRSSGCCRSSGRPWSFSSSERCR